MKMKQFLRRSLLAAALLSPLSALASQVIVTVADQQITAADLQQAISSSPFSVQFPAMDRDDQAALRGDLIKRLVAQRLLYLEALKRKLDDSPRFKADLKSYELGLLYRAYMESIRAGISLSADELAQLEKDYKGEPDALVAAKSALIGERYKTLKPLKLHFLKDKYHLKTFDARITPDLKDDTILAQADGIELNYGDVRKEGEAYNQAKVEERLYRRLEVLLVAKAARDDGIDVSAATAQFRRERLPSLLIDDMAQQWIPDEATEQAYFKAHPELGQVQEQRLVAQLVVKEEKQAEALRKRILAGESFYELAKNNSLDPYGRKHAGDMGWMSQGTAMPAIEAALDKLPENQVSEVVKTKLGYHLLMVRARKKAKQMSFDAVRDLVRQAILNAKLPPFLNELQTHYQVQWQMPMANGKQAVEQGDGHG